MKEIDPKDIETEDGIKSLTDEDRKRIEAQLSEYAGRGMRVLAFSKRHIEDGNTRENTHKANAFSLVSIPWSYRSDSSNERL